MKQYLFSRGTACTASIAILLIRLSAGFLMAIGHGYPKLTNIPQTIEAFEKMGMGGAISVYLAIFAEFFCSIALIFGFMQRLALIPLIVTMSVAFFVFHKGVFIGVLGAELSLLYLVVFLCLLIAGPGKYSLDEMINKNR